MAHGGSIRTGDFVSEEKVRPPTIGPEGRIARCSKSQTKTHQLCPRKWWYDKVAHIPRGEPSKGALASGEAHKRMELWLKTGADPRNSIERYGEEMIAPYLWAVPWQGGPMVVEGTINDPTILTHGGVELTGEFDVLVPGAEGRDPVIIDHKFLKTLDYASTEEELTVDSFEPVFYAGWALLRQPEAEACEFRHHNHNKTKRENKVVTIRQTRAELMERMRELGRYIDGPMQATAAIKNAEDVPTGELPTACKAFGGCEYQKTCPDAPQNRFGRALRSGDLADYFADGNSDSPSTGDKTIMGLLDQVESPPTPPSQIAPPMMATPAAVAAPAKRLPALAAADAVVGCIYKVQDKAAKYKGLDEGKCLFVTFDKQFLEIDGEEIVRDLASDAASLALFAPPAAATKPAEPAKKRVVIQDDEAKIETKAPAAFVDTTPKIDPKTGIVPPDAPPDTTKVGEVAVSVTVDEANKAEKKAGRPAGAKNKPKAGVDSLVIVVNAASTHGESLAPYIADIETRLLAQLKLVDLRLAPKESDAAFMGWRGLLTIEAKKAPPVAGFYTVQSGDLADPVIEALGGLPGTVVIRGAR